MSILKSKKGIILVEVLLSFTIFFIFFSTMLYIESSRRVIKNYNYRMDNSISKANEVKGILINKLKYEDIKDLYFNHGKRYINDIYLSQDSLEDIVLSDFLVTSKGMKDNYMEIILSEEKPLKITLRYNFNLLNNMEIIECCFYKGNYF